MEALAFTGNHLPGSRRDGVAVTRIEPRLRLGNTPMDPGFRHTVERTIETTLPEVVVAHTPVPFPAQMAYLAAKTHDIPFVTTYHAGRLRGSSIALNGLAALDRWTLERRMLAGSARLVAVGPYVRDHALARHRERVHIVPPGVDAGRFKPAGAPDTPNILFVGPLSRSYRWKGIDVLWDAFQEVRKHLPQARLTLVGEGDRFQEFRERAEPLGDTVRLLGRLSEEALVAQYRSAAVVVLPSTSDAESFGMVLAEANACGRPVVGSDIGGIPDFVRDGDNGLLAAPGDAASLAAKILELLEDPETADEMGRRGRDRVLREHDWDRLTATTETVLEAALQAS